MAMGNTIDPPIIRLNSSGSRPEDFTHEIVWKKVNLNQFEWSNTGFSKYPTGIPLLLVDDAKTAHRNRVFRKLN